MNDTDDALADELRQSLIAAGVRPRDLTPLPGREARAEEALARILRTQRREGAAARPARRWPRWGALVLAAAVVAVALVVVWPGRSSPPAYASTPPLLTFPHEKAGTLPATGRDAAPSLERLADRAAEQPEPADAPVQHVVLSAWWSSTDESEAGVVRSVLEPVESESFFLPDGTMRRIERRGPPLNRQGRIVPARGSAPALTDESFDFSDPGPTYADELPIDPEELGALLARDQDPTTCQVTGACLVSAVVDLHFNYVVPPDLTAALWRVLATDPSITYLGRVRDRLNRPADAFTTAGLDDVSQQLLLIDPVTGLYLGEEAVLVRPSKDYEFTPPAVVSFTTLVRSERIGHDQMPSSAARGG